MPTNKPRFSIQLEDDVAEKLRLLAKADGRPIANYLAHLVKEAIGDGPSVAETQADYGTKKPLGVKLTGDAKIRAGKTSEAKKSATG